MHYPTVLAAGTCMTWGKYRFADQADDQANCSREERKGWQVELCKTCDVKWNQLSLSDGYLEFKWKSTFYGVFNVLWKLKFFGSMFAWNDSIVWCIYTAFFLWQFRVVFFGSKCFPCILEGMCWCKFDCNHEAVKAEAFGFFCLLVCDYLHNGLAGYSYIYFFDKLVDTS